MITLYKFGNMDDICDPSQFCVKVEAYLRLAGLPYDTKSGARYLRQAPKGKLPFITDNGQVIADSAFILAYLKATYGDWLDAGLSTADKAIAHAFSRMLDEHLYWVISHARWQLPHNRAVLGQYFFKALPYPLDRLVAYQAARKVRAALFRQGLGRHSEAEILELGSRDLTALSDLLGDKAYFFGSKPTSFDATAYGTLAQLILLPMFSAPIFDKARTYQNLVAFTTRFHAQYFSA